MSGEERLNEFKRAIEEWLSSKNVISIEPNSEVEETLNLSRLAISKASSSECAVRAYELYAYSEYINHILNKEQYILDWAENALWYIVADKLQQYGGKFAKWQEKYYSAVKENPLAVQILKIKQHATARVTLLSGKADKIQKMADILQNLSKRR